MSAYNGAAYIQRHSPRFNGPYAERGDQFLCGDGCGRILSRQWFRDIYGCEPEQYGRRESPLRHVFADPPRDFIDPSDEVGFNVEHRGPR